MSGKLRLYKEKLEGYNHFYSIVRTIKMVTMAKFRQLQSRMKTRDYTLRYTEKAFSTAHAAERGGVVNGKSKQVCIPVMTNRGSCGAMNSNVLRTVDMMSDNKMVLMPLGKKGIETMSKLYPDAFGYGIINDMKEPMHFAYASYVWENASALCPDADGFQVIFHRCVSAASQRQCYYSIPSYDKWKSDLVDASSTENQKHRYLFANSLLNEEEELIRDFYDFNASLAILNAVCENELSEQAARLVAVEGQLSNITTLQQLTSSLYNKTRQSSITSSLIEIISAMTSLESNSAKGVQRANFWENASRK